MADQPIDADLSGPDEAIRYLRALPKKDYLAMAGRQARTVLEQADLYELPLRGKRVDLVAVVRAVHEMFAKYQHDFSRARRLTRMRETDDGEREASEFDYWTAEKVKEQTLDLRDKREKRELETLYREDVHAVHRAWAAQLQKLANHLRRDYPEAHDLLNETLEDCERLLEPLFTQEEDED